MVRVRKLVLAIAAASALSSGMAHALGLGEVTLHSALNQPLVAEIEVLEARDLESSEVVPRLASPEEFNKVGVDRQFFLTDLKFTPVIKPNGKSVIRVTSSKPVREPYLNFLVEVLWPSGRLLREYTLLLDPPLYSPQTASAAPQAPQAARSAGTVSRAPAAPAYAAPAPVPAAPRASQPSPAPAGSLDGKEYKTTSNDTLWEVSERARKGGTVHQTMLAIQDLNPDAFIDGNINRMRSGQVLRLPDEQQIQSRSQSEALAQVAAQNAAWRESRTRPAATAARQLDATRRSEAGSAPAQVESKDSLRLVSADSGKATSGSDKGGDGQSAANTLAVTKENLDAAQRENAELKSRMGDLESQLEKLQRLIQLKDEQLAKLEANLAQQGQPVAADAAQSQAVAAPGAPLVGENTSQGASEAEPAAAAPAPAEPGAVQADPAAGSVGVTAPAVAAAEPSVAAPAVNKVEPAQPKPVPVKPVAPPKVEEAPSTSMVDEVMGNPMMLGAIGGGGLLALLVGLMGLARRRAAKKAEEEEEIQALEADPLFDDGLPQSGAAAPLNSAAMAPLATQEQQAAQAGDALGEADIYIAYGRFNKAAELLQAASNDEPNRRDLRLKLMEVYAELGDREGYARQERELRDIGGSQPQIDQLNAKYPAMAAFAAAAMVGGMALADELEPDLDLATAVEPETLTDTALGGDLEWSLDDLEAELEKDLQGSASSIGQSGLSLEGFSLESDIQQAPIVETADDFSFDLDLPEATAPLSESAEDINEFSLNLDAPVQSDATGEESEFLMNFDAASQQLDASSAEIAPQPRIEQREEEAGLGDLDLSGEFTLDSAQNESDDGLMLQLDELDAELDQLTAGLAGESGDSASVPSLDGQEREEDFDFLTDADETATKLDLARAYIEMGDTDGARDILDEVLNEGNESQQQEARDMFSRLA